MTGGYKVKKIYVGSRQVRPKTWRPGENTIAYYPLNGDANDYSGNSRNLTTVTNVDFSSTLSSGQKVAYFNGSNSQLTWAYDMMSVTTDTLTLSMWLKKTRNHTNHEIFQEIMYQDGNNDFRIQTKSTSASVTGNIGFNWWFGSNYTAVGGYNNTGVANNVWRHVVLVGTPNGMKLYQNGEELTITYDSSSQAGLSLKEFTTIVLGGRDGVFGQGYISEAIFENKARTAQEILDYYNQTKSNYGL